MGNSQFVWWGACVALAGAGFTRAADFDWVDVGDPGNPGRVLTNETLGSVAAPFRISRDEVTNAQYADFLNAADPNGQNPNGIYNALMGSNARGGVSFVSQNAPGGKYVVRPNMANKPVNFVSWYDAARFANWVNNGQGSGSTETGAYDMLNLVAYGRMPGARVFLPSRDQWIKAGYYDPRTAAQGGPVSYPHYWTYPTMSDSQPTPALADAVGNVANPGPNVSTSGAAADWNGQDGNVTTVGSTGSVSYYGTRDQAGNVKEWTDGSIPWGCGTPDAKGGDWYLLPVYGNITNLGNTPATSESDRLGFRIAMIPEPATGAFLLIAAACVRLCRGPRRRPARAVR